MKSVAGVEFAEIVGAVMEVANESANGFIELVYQEALGIGLNHQLWHTEVAVEALCKHQGYSRSFASIRG